MLVRLLIDDKFDESLKCSLASVKMTVIHRDSVKLIGNAKMYLVDCWMKLLNNLFMQIIPCA